MEKSPTTDRSLGLHQNWDNEKFSSVRQKAKREWEERHIKAKRNRQLPIPKFKIDEEVVIAKGYYSGSRDYALIKIIDFEESSRSFIYYGIVLKVTDKSMLNRIGRLACTDRSWFGFYPANVGPEKIKWVENENNKNE